MLRAFRIGVSLMVFATFANACCSGYTGAGCFLLGTHIATPKGEVPIEKLELGMEVYAYDQVENRIVVAPIDAIVERQATEYLRVQVASGKVLLVTPDHPVFLPASAKWVPIGEVQTDQWLLTMNPLLAPESMGMTQVTAQRLAQPERVFNLKVRHYNNAFAEGVLAHFY